MNYKELHTADKEVRRETWVLRQIVCLIKGKTVLAGWPGKKSIWSFLWNDPLFHRSLIAVLDEIGIAKSKSGRNNQPWVEFRRPHCNWTHSVIRILALTNPITLPVTPGAVSGRHFVQHLDSITLPLLDPLFWMAWTVLPQHGWIHNTAIHHEWYGRTFCKVPKPIN